MSLPPHVLVSSAWIVLAPASYIFAWHFVNDYYNNFVYSQCLSNPTAPYLPQHYNFLAKRLIENETPLRITLAESPYSGLDRSWLDLHDNNIKVRDAAVNKLLKVRPVQQIFGDFGLTDNELFLKACYKGVVITLFFSPLIIFLAK